MTPTPKLRFVERSFLSQPMCKNFDSHGNTLQAVQTMQIVRILQQWWAVERAGQLTPTGEWRDVPIEKDAA